VFSLSRFLASGSVHCNFQLAAMCMIGAVTEQDCFSPSSSARQVRRHPPQLDPAKKRSAKCTSTGVQRRTPSEPGELLLSPSSTHRTRARRILIRMLSCVEDTSDGQTPPQRCILLCRSPETTAAAQDRRASQTQGAGGGVRSVVVWCGWMGRPWSVVGGYGYGTEYIALHRLSSASPPAREEKPVWSAVSPET